MRRTKIVATIGPASREPEVLIRMVEAGMDVARLNYSHGTLDEHAETARRVRDAAGRVGRPVAILQDLPGPKLRIGPLSEGVVELTPGEKLTFSCGDGDRPGDARQMSISWAGLADAVEAGSVLYLADGSVRLRVTDVRAPEHEVDVEIEVGGAVASRQGLNIPGPVASLPAVPEEDLHLLAHGESIGVDMVALSFVQTPQDVEFVREHTRLPLVAKMEKPQAVERASDIIAAADGVMVARGDLGIELPIERAPVDHGDADARLDGQLLAPHARGGGGCGKRDPGRHGRGHALPGDCGGRPPGGGGGNDGGGGGAGGVDRAV
jgi:pyruvate kinase